MCEALAQTSNAEHVPKGHILCIKSIQIAPTSAVTIYNSINLFLQS
jgi:hypothetical protein